MAQLGTNRVRWRERTTPTLNGGTLHFEKGSATATLSLGVIDDLKGERTEARAFSSGAGMDGLSHAGTVNLGRGLAGRAGTGRGPAWHPQPSPPTPAIVFRARL